MSSITEAKANSPRTLGPKRLSGTAVSLPSRISNKPVNDEAESMDASLRRRNTIDDSSASATPSTAPSNSRHNSVLSQSDLLSRYRRETMNGALGINVPTTMNGTLYKKKGNASLYKLTSVIKDLKPGVVWKEREFSISEEGILSYSKPNKKRVASLDLRGVIVRLSSPYQDQYGGYHVHMHTFDGAPTPFTFEIGSRHGLDAMWSLCARSEKEMMEWLLCIIHYMLPTGDGDGDQLDDSQFLTREASPGQSGVAGSSDELFLSVSGVEILHRGESNYSEHSHPMLGQGGNSSHYNNSVASASRLLYKPDIGGTIHSQQSQLGATTMLRLLEGAVGFALLNLLLGLFLFSTPNSIESYLFAGAINLLVCFGILVRLDQFGADILVRSQGVPMTRASGVMQPSGGGASTPRLLEIDDSDADDTEESVTQVANPEQVMSTTGAAPHTSSKTGKRHIMSSNLKAVSASEGSAERDSPGVLVPPHSYSRVDARTMDVRIGPNYRKEGRKAPSEPALMNLIGADLYYSESKLDFIAEKLLFPEPSTNQYVGLEGGDGGSNRYKTLPGNIPHFFVFNIQIQKAGTTGMLGARAEGYSLICYFEPSEKFLQEVESLSRPDSAFKCSNAAKLTSKWLTSFHVDTALRERLKLKATVLNKETCEISSWVLRYNGKPAMITKSNTMSRVVGKTQRGRLCEVVECDVDLRVWNLLFRQGLNAVFPNLHKISFALGFVIEGETDDELPECILGGVQLNHIDTTIVNHW